MNILQHHLILCAHCQHLYRSVSAVQLTCFSRTFFHFLSEHLQADDLDIDTLLAMEGVMHACLCKTHEECMRIEMRMQIRLAISN